MAVENFASSVTATTIHAAFTAQTTHTEKKEPADDHKAWYVAEAHVKWAAKTSKSFRPLPEAVDRLSRSPVTVSLGSLVIDCSSGEVSHGTSVLIAMYDAKGKVIPVSKVSENGPPPPITSDILKGKSSRCATAHKIFKPLSRTAIQIESSQGQKASGALMMKVTA